jgi:DNA modification methylase
MKTQITDFFSATSQQDYLLCRGDAAEVLQEFPARSVHCCITSPPYWNQRLYTGGSRLGQEPCVEDYVQHLRKIFRQLQPVLKEEGSLWLNLGDTYRNKNLLGVPWRVAFALQADGWILRNAIVWDKRSL